MDPQTFATSLFFSDPLPGDLNGPFFLFTFKRMYNYEIAFICGSNITIIDVVKKRIASSYSIKSSTGDPFHIKHIALERPFEYETDTYYGIAEINQTNYWVSIDGGNEKKRKKNKKKLESFLNYKFLENGILNPLQSLESLQFPEKILGPGFSYIANVSTIITGQDGCTMTLIQKLTGKILSSKPLDYGKIFPCSSTNSLQSLLSW